MKLSRAGYGDINTIKNLNAQEFMDLVHYENYLAKYAELVRALNSGKIRNKASSHAFGALFVL